MKSTILLGQGSLAIRIAEWFHRSDDFHLAAVAPVDPPRPMYASLGDWADTAGVPVLRHDELLVDVDLGFSCFYDRIITPATIARFGLLLNLHNAPLPKYRGVRPINWALENGEREHGVTIHRIDAGIDTGPVYAQARFSVYPDDEVIDVYRKCLAFGWLLFTNLMPRLEDVDPLPQDDAAATYYSLADADRLVTRRGFTRDDRPADWLPL